MNPADSLLLTTALTLAGAVTLGFSTRTSYGFGMLSGLGLMFPGLMMVMGSFGHNVLSPNIPLTFGYLVSAALASAVFYSIAAD